MKSSILQNFVAGAASIAATIMVLQLSTPEAGDLMGLISQWPSLLAHFVSFFLIFILWYSYSKEISKVDEVDSAILLVNALWLIFLVLIPFATAWLQKYPTKAGPEFFFTLILSLCLFFDRLTISMLEKENPHIVFSKRIGMEARAPIYLTIFASFVISVLFPGFNGILLSAITIYMAWLMVKTRRQNISII